MNSIKDREKIINGCFGSWITKDREQFKNSFSEDVVYIESWGPAYKNLHDVIKWFDDWHVNNSVLKWDIKRFVHDNDICICEWYFKCICSNEDGEFDGVSIVEFDSKNKIKWIKEFQSKIPNYYPYQ